MKENRYATLKRLILACMIIVPVVPFILMLCIGYYYFKTSIESSTVASMRRIVEDHRQMIDTFLAERRADLQFILQSNSYETLVGPENLQAIFNHLQRQSHAFVDLGLFNEEGIHINYQGPFRLVGIDYGKEPWFMQVLKDGYYISDVFLGFRRIPHFIIALTKKEGGKTWVLRATIDTHLFNDLVKKVRIGKTGEAYILNGEGIFQTERRSGGNLMDKDQEDVAHAKLHEGIRTFIHEDRRGGPFLYATTWLHEKIWMMVVRQEKADAFSSLRSATYAIVLIFVMGVSGIIGIALYLTDRIVRRMEQTDVERERLSEQLVRAGRLAELGEMASGFAHEINNPLQIMKSEQALIEVIFADMKERGEVKVSQDLEDIEDSMDQIKKQIDRCAKITQAILKFGRQGEAMERDVDLHEFIPEVLAMVEKKASVQGIRIRLVISQETPFIHVDPGQLQQVLLNLFNNAIDAVIEGRGAEGGEIDVEVGPGDSKKVEMRVKDNGCGISPENMEKIFSPFFTTKPVGKGTGLGLSICYGIIKNMGGEMEASSERGFGTSFLIRLQGKGES